MSRADTAAVMIGLPVAVLLDRESQRMRLVIDAEEIGSAVAEAEASGDLEAAADAREILAALASWNGYAVGAFLDAEIAP